MVKFNCDYCMAEGFKCQSDYNKTKRHFCSWKCYLLFRTERLPKEEQPRYGKGLDPEEAKRRIRARSAIGHYLRDKKIPRPPCEICGDPKSEAHHDDYSKPLDVKWLCVKHHNLYHKIGVKIYDEILLKRIIQKLD